MTVRDLPVEKDALADAAVAYATMGLAVFPIAPRGKLPLIAKSEGGNGFHDATTDLEQVRAWWKREPQANIGLAVPAAHVVFDVDGGDGIASRRELERQHGPLPFTLRQITGSGGEHWIFADPNPDELRQDVKFRAGLDTRCAGRGYVIVAPSVHPCGGVYRWLAVAEPAPLPLWLRAMIKKPETQPRATYVPPANPLPSHMRGRERYARGVLRGVCDEVAAAAEGQRNDTLNKAWWRAQQFRDVLPLAEARPALLRAAAACGLGEREAARVLR